jgi:hypothetical protein
VQSVQRGAAATLRGEVVKKPWDRLLACHFPHIIDRLEAYPTNKITASERFFATMLAYFIAPLR